MSTSWGAIEQALRAWVVTASGFPESNVIWSHQDGDRPADPFITLNLSGMRQIGALDEVLATTPRDDNGDISGAPGAEVRLEVRGMRELLLSVQAFTDAVVGDSGARALLAKVQAALYLPSIRDELRALSISPFDAGEITIIPVVFPTGFEGRGVLAVRIYVCQVVEEYTTYIETVKVGVGLTPVVGVKPWHSLTTYVPGIYIAVHGGFYLCITGGVSGSAESGGPSGTGSDIVDGSVHWRYSSTYGELEVTS